MFELVDQTKELKQDGLAGFFDLLARFDFEDQKKSGNASGSAVSAPAGSKPFPDEIYGADRKAA